MDSQSPANAWSAIKASKSFTWTNRSPQNCDLRFLTIGNFLQKLLFDSLNGTACFPFKNHFRRLHYNALSTRGDGKTAKLPKVKLDFSFRSYYFLGASRIINNSLPLSSRNIITTVLFRKALDDQNLYFFFYSFKRFLALCMLTFIYFSCYFY